MGQQHLSAHPTVIEDYFLSSFRHFNIFWFSFTSVFLEEMSDLFIYTFIFYRSARKPFLT